MNQNLFQLRGLRSRVHASGSLSGFAKRSGIPLQRLEYFFNWQLRPDPGFRKRIEASLALLEARQRDPGMCADPFTAHDRVVRIARQYGNWFD